MTYHEGKTNKVRDWINLNITLKRGARTALSPLNLKHLVMWAFKGGLLTTDNMEALTAFLNDPEINWEQLFEDNCLYKQAGDHIDTMLSIDHTIT